MDAWIDALVNEAPISRCFEEFGDLDDAAAAALVRADPERHLARLFDVADPSELEQAVAKHLRSWLSREPRSSRQISRARAVLRAWLLSTDEETRLQIAARLGEEVLSLCWDGGGVGMSGYIYIRRAGGMFFEDVEGTVVGPHESLEDALSEWAINGATQSVDCPLLSSSDLVRLLPLFDGVEPGFRVFLNGEEFEAMEHGDRLVLRPVGE